MNRGAKTEVCNEDAEQREENANNPEGDTDLCVCGDCIISAGVAKRPRIETEETKSRGQAVGFI